jgi:hypothetical protein
VYSCGAAAVGVGLRCAGGRAEGGGWRRWCFRCSGGFGGEFVGGEFVAYGAVDVDALQLAAFDAFAFALGVGGRGGGRWWGRWEGL